MFDLSNRLTSINLDLKEYAGVPKKLIVGTDASRRSYLKWFELL